MKIKRLYETGECSTSWEWAKNHPEDHSEEAADMRWLNTLIEEIIDDLDDKSILELINIKGFDKYQGPYASVKIFGKNYKIWMMANAVGGLFIPDFPISNTKEDQLPGLYDSTFNIAILLNEINYAGGIDLYLSSKKYNL